jgi:NAD(P)-dependent dehydrogenase (short-subunit alcohol dehydrogenase family)
MTGRLQGKVAFITGGGSGIGEATAHRFAEEKAVVVICGRRKELLDGVVAAIRAKGGKADGVQVDVSNERPAQSTVLEIHDRGSDPPADRGALCRWSCRSTCAIWTRT